MPSQAAALCTMGLAAIHVAMTGAVAAAAVQVRRATPCKRKANVAMHARGRGGDDTSMKVAYVFAANMSSTFKLAQMILPQLENLNHGAQVREEKWGGRRPSIRRRKL